MYAQVTIINHLLTYIQPTPQYDTIVPNIAHYIHYYDDRYTPLRVFILSGIG